MQYDSQTEEDGRERRWVELGREGEGEGEETASCSRNRRMKIDGVWEAIDG